MILFILKIFGFMASKKFTIKDEYRESLLTLCVHFLDQLNILQAKSDFGYIH